ncbi:MAG TPA: hypothetical protein VK604_25900 [Bryobacteraceae bacterium]|nr:hypothetical protein [Bryobacteraceae bacterium]HTF67261.1 hypothetical protein [Edaphobacter sp.]
MAFEFFRCTMQDAAQLSIPAMGLDLTVLMPRQLVMILPGMDVEQFFTGLGSIMANGRPEKAILDKFGAHWNVEFLGPPISAASGDD